MKFLKWLLICILSIVLLGVVGCFVISEDRPLGNPSKEADEMASNMLDALNADGLKKINFIRWTFRGGHDFLYDQMNRKALVTWGENKVILDLNTQKGPSYVNGQKVTGKKKMKLEEKAWSYWCNDSFWLLAPFKVFDPGTERKIVADQDGRKGLLIEYTSGGVTPGDAYLWLLDDQNVPTGWKMWTSIIPIKGIYTSWENWEVHDEVKFATMHNMSISIPIDNLKTGDSFSDFGYTTNPFNEQ